MAVVQPQAFPQAIAEHEACVVHRHACLVTRHDLAIEVDQDVAVAGVILGLMSGQRANLTGLAGR